MQEAVAKVQPSSVRQSLPLLAVFGLAVAMAVGTAAFGTMAVLPIFGVLLVGLVVTRPEYGIALFLSTFLMSYPKALQGSGYLTINNVLGGIFALMLIYKVYRDADWWFVRCPEIQLLAFIILTYAASERFNAPDPDQIKLLGAGFYFAEGLRTFVNRAAFTLFFINYIRTPGHLRMVYLLALAFMVLTALTGVQGVLQGGGLKGYRAFTEATELVGGQAGIIRAAGNPNRLAMFAILAIAGLWYLMQALRLPVVRFMAIPTIVMLALAVFMTASRSGLLGLGVCALAILVDQGFDVRKLLTFVLAGLLLMTVVVQFVPEKSLERITNLPGTEAGERGEGAASLERRQYTWDVAVDLFQKNPMLGVGMGNWAVARFLSDPGRSAGSPHNSYLLASVEGGIFCLAAFLALLWRTWRDLRIAEKYVCDPASPLGDIGWIVKTAKVSFLVLVFFSLVADLWNLVFLFLLVGTGVVARRLAEQSARAEALAY